MVGATQSQRKYEKTLENMHLKLKTNLTQYVYCPIHLPHLQICEWLYWQLESYRSISTYGRLETYGSLNFHDLIFWKFSKYFTHIT